MGGAATGGGGAGGTSLQNSSSATATSGDAEGLSGSGNKIFNFGSNASAGAATSAIQNTLANPFVIIGAIAVVWLMTRKRRR